MMQLEKYGFISLDKKINVFITFKKWKFLVENETVKKLKCLRSNNGGEYCSHEFKDYFSTNGIFRHKTIPRTPKENGVHKEHEIAYWVSLKHVDGSFQYYYIFD